MVMPKELLGGAGIPLIPGMAGDKSGSKYLITAILSAGENGCQCKSCQLLKKFGSAMADAVLKEGDNGGA
jgi:hypothetical protein